VANSDIVRQAVANVLNIAHLPDSQVSLFDLGFSSLELLQLQAILSAQIKGDLPLRAIISSPTIHALTQYVSAFTLATHESDNFIVPLTDAASGPTIVLTHTVVGQVTDYIGLVTALRNHSLQIIGLEQPGLSGSPFLERVEQLADTYIRGLNDASLEATVLIGYSLGALVAYAMAQKINAATGSHPTLIFVDPAPPWNPPPDIGQDPLEYWAWRYGKRIEATLQDFRDIGDEDTVLDTIIQGLKARNDLHARYKWADPGFARRLLRAGRSSMVAAWTFNPSPSNLAAHVVLAHSAEDGANKAFSKVPESQALQWHMLLRGGIEFHAIGGDHATCMIKPHVDDLRDLILQLAT
jgi:thioesterase domain-containing protein